MARLHPLHGVGLGECHAAVREVHHRHVVDQSLFIGVEHVICRYGFIELSLVACVARIVVMGINQLAAAFPFVRVSSQITAGGNYVYNKALV